MIRQLGIRKDVFKILEFLMFYTVIATVQSLVVVVVPT